MQARLEAGGPWKGNIRGKLEVTCKDKRIPVTQQAFIDLMFWKA